MVFSIFSKISLSVSCGPLNPCGTYLDELGAQVFVRAVSQETCGKLGLLRSALKCDFHGFLQRTADFSANFVSRSSSQLTGHPGMLMGLPCR